GGDGGRDTLVVDADPSGRGSEDIGTGDEARCGDSGDAPEEDGRSDNFQGMHRDDGPVRHGGVYFLATRDASRLTRLNQIKGYTISNDRRFPLRRGQLMAQDPMYCGRVVRD
ncbi:hypothetical protein CH063_14191, partial [Colletotrichum higginsianum]